MTTFAPFAGLTPAHPAKTKLACLSTAGLATGTNAGLAKISSDAGYFGRSGPLEP